MKRSVGALLSCASSTSRTTRAMVLSCGRRRDPDAQRAVAVDRAGEDGVARRPCASGTLSPVTGASSMALSPATITPSAGMRSPGPDQDDRRRPRGSRPAPPRVLPSALEQGGLRARAWSGPGCWRAHGRRRRLRAARRRGTGTRTIAASSVAPMITAPTAAMVISVSIENGVPKQRRHDGAPGDRHQADGHGSDEGPVLGRRARAGRSRRRRRAPGRRRWSGARVGSSTTALIGAMIVQMPVQAGLRLGTMIVVVICDHDGR